MSREGSDFSYKPKRGAVKAETEGKRRVRSQRTSRVDYTEVHILSEMDSEGTVEAEFKAEDNLWTPETLTKRASQLTQQV